MTSEDIVEMKTVFADPDEPDLILVQVYPPNATLANVASGLRTYPGVGQPFLAFASIPSNIQANPAADFTDAPLVDASVAVNEAAINDMLSDTALQTLPNDTLQVAS
jgi:hypothetical protein